MMLCNNNKLIAAISLFKYLLINCHCRNMALKKKKKKCQRYLYLSATFQRVECLNYLLHVSTCTQYYKLFFFV